MHVTRMHLRNILLTLVVACAFVIDAHTARAATPHRPGSPPALPHDGAGCHGNARPQSPASDPGLRAGGLDRWRPART